jgi:hypothetical protein
VLARYRAGEHNDESYVVYVSQNDGALAPESAAVLACLTDLQLPHRRVLVSGDRSLAMRSMTGHWAPRVGRCGASWRVSECDRPIWLVKRKGGKWGGVVRVVAVEWCDNVHNEGVQ